MVPNFEQCLIAPTSAILEAMQAINRTDAKIALVIDGERRLLGTVTDGDVRRGLLRGLQLTAPVSEVMNAAPKSVRPGEDRSRILDLVQRNVCRQFPVLDAGGRVTGIETFDDAVLSLKRDNWIVVLAGGRGTRLLPLTAERPKPMLHVGNQPILATIIGNLARQGFVNIFISLNYRGEMIRSYFGDGSDWNVNIRYLMEDSSLGTAGALSLLPEKPTLPVIVTNGDILTTVDFNNLLDFHRAHGAVGTMCISEYSFQVPFGVVDIKGHTIASITEKPWQRFLISAGIYVLQPEAIDLVPRDVRHDMPELFGRLISDGRETCVFPIGEYWTDIGKAEDLERANRDFFGNFPHAIESAE
jgi:dTDP-glucose pyrophosphorylase